MTVFSMDPRRYRLHQRPPQVINLVDYEVIDLVDFEEKINWIPKPNMKKKNNNSNNIDGKSVSPSATDNSRADHSRLDDTSTIASRSTAAYLEHHAKTQLPLYDALLCPAATLLEQSREEEDEDESPYFAHANEQISYAEDREAAVSTEVDFIDCVEGPRELWFGCLMDAAGEAAEILSYGIVGASSNSHERATHHLLERRQRLLANKAADPDIPDIVTICDLPQDQAEATEASRQNKNLDIPEVVNLCDPQEAEAEAESSQLNKKKQPQEPPSQQHDMLMMLPVKKKEDPPAEKKVEEGSFPLLEIHVPDTDENEDMKE
mmetsp:Transcript_33767/g.81866  ORF Transcript_33767/g.81866 Transcript_33767/m.81866 type:complete len:320 (+) Transcript_33767:55-1014(+)